MSVSVDEALGLSSPGKNSTAYEWAMQPVAAVGIALYSTQGEWVGGRGVRDRQAGREGSFSAISKPNLATTYSLESSSLSVLVSA